MSNEHNNSPGMFPEPTEVERLLQQMATSFPRTMEEEAREPQEYLTGKLMSPAEYNRRAHENWQPVDAQEFGSYLNPPIPVQARHEHPVCPFCGQRHPLSIRVNRSL